MGGSGGVGGSGGNGGDGPGGNSYGIYLDKSSVNGTNNPGNTQFGLGSPGQGGLDGSSASIKEISILFTPNLSPQNQILTFDNIGDIPFTSQIILNATSSSGLQVLFSVISGPATINGNILKISQQGDITIKAIQPGNKNFYPVEKIQVFKVKRWHGTKHTIWPHLRQIFR